MQCNVAIERTNIHVLFTLLFAVGLDISILRAPKAAAISPFMSPLNPPKPMMSDNVSDEDRPQHRGTTSPALFE